MFNDPEFLRGGANRGSSIENRLTATVTAEKDHAVSELGVFASVEKMPSSSGERSEKMITLYKVGEGKWHNASICKSVQRRPSMIESKECDLETRRNKIKLSGTDAHRSTLSL